MIRASHVEPPKPTKRLLSSLHKPPDRCSGNRIRRRKRHGRQKRSAESEPHNSPADWQPEGPSQLRPAIRSGLLHLLFLEASTPVAAKTPWPSSDRLAGQWMTGN